MTKLAPRLPALLIALVLFSSAAKADTIKGAIAFGGLVTLDSSSTSAATRVVEWTDTRTIKASGDFATFVAPNDSVSFQAPWFFNSGPVSSFWEVNGFQFDLTSSAIVYQTDMFLFVSGTGVISGHGFTPTAGKWNFSTQSPSTGSTFSFSASESAVSDGGTTVILLGVTLVGLYLTVQTRKRLA